MSILDLAQDGQLIVKQRVEGLEAITGIETKNRYEVMTPDGQTVLFAYEESGGWGRVLLQRNRALTLHVAGLDGREVLAGSRAFFWFFPTMYVRGPNGSPIGTIRRKFGILKRRILLENPQGETVAEVNGSVFRRYTFMVNRGGQEVGRITKKWSGVGREMFTDADTFQVQLPTEHDEQLQQLVLATAFAVDLDFFEK